MKISKLILLLLVAFSTTTVSAQTLNEISVQMNKAGELYNGKKYAEAITEFNKTLKMISTTTEEGVEAIEGSANKLVANSYRLNGMTLARARKFDAAIAELKNAAKSYSKVGDIMNQRKSESLVSACYGGMAADKAKAKDYNGAAEVCLKGIAENKMDTKLMLLAAHYYEKANKNAESIMMYEKVITLANKSSRFRADGKKASNFLVNGQLAAASKLAEKGKTQDAIDRINVALKYNPKSYKAQLMRLQTYFKAKNYANVIKYAPEAATTQLNSSTKSDVYFMLGASYVGLNQHDKALASYKKVIAGGSVAAAKAQIAVINKNLAAAAKNAANK